MRKSEPAGGAEKRLRRVGQSDARGLPAAPSKPLHWSRTTGLREGEGCAPRRTL
jgi:hypothetical protein